MIRKQQYKLVALGGTFDHFHTGHKDFIQFASSLSQRLLIGVTDEKMVLGKRLSHLIQPLYQRKQAVSKYCAEHNILAEIVTIHDAFGPTIEPSKIQALVCTTDTQLGAEKINEVREKLNLNNLPIHVHKLVIDIDGIGPISSYRIRNGEINRDGAVYQSLFSTNLKLTKEMKSFFKKQQGDLLISGPKHNSGELNIVVGDSTLRQFIKNNWSYDLGIFDLKEQRQPSKDAVISDLKNVQKIKNPAGQISTESVETLNKWKNNQNSFKHLFVEGEEDLLAVAAVLIAPLQTKIFYGQPETGIIEMTATEQLKEQVFKVLNPNLSRK